MEMDMKVILTEEIEWKVARPVDFPCFICGKEEAVYKTTIKKGDVIYILCACGDCNRFDVLEEFLDGGRGIN